MSSEELRESARRQPFEPFRIVLTDGAAFEIRHPDLIMVGVRTAVVGLVKQADQTMFDQSVKIDLLHVVRIEPLAVAVPPGANGDG